MTDIHQSCWVVPDLIAAAERWVKMGVGPFVTIESSFPDAIYRGERVPLEIFAGLAQAGPMQIELIEQRSPGPSAYRDSFAPGESGFHHVAKIVPDYDEQVAALRARGIVIATEAIFDGKPFCYADTRAEIGAMLEIVPDTSVIRELNAAVVAAARGWDGRTVTQRLG